MAWLKRGGVLGLVSLCSSAAYRPRRGVVLYITFVPPLLDALLVSRLMASSKLFSCFFGKALLKEDYDLRKKFR